MAALNLYIFLKKYHWLWLSLIVLLGIALSRPQLKQPMIAEADAYSRANISLERAQDGLFFNNYGGSWLPLYSTIMVSLLTIFPFSFLTLKFSTLVFSLSSILAIYFYTKAFIQNRLVALLSSLFFTLLPLRIFLSTQTLTESVFVFFILVSLALIAKSSLSYKKIILSLLFLNIAHGIRYESWIILPLVWSFIISKPINFKKKFFYFFCSTLFPIYWLYLNHLNHGDFLMFFREKHRVAQIQKTFDYFNLNLAITNWGKKLLRVFSPFFIVVSFFSLSSIFKKISLKKIIFFGLPFYYFFALVAQVFFGTMEWFPTRYLLIPISFLIPLLALSVFQISKKLNLIQKKHTLGKIFSVLVVFCLAFLFQRNYLKMVRNTRDEITVNSLMQNYDSSSPAEQKPLYRNFLNLINQCELSCNNQVVFLYRDTGRSYLSEALFYFLNQSPIVFPKSALTERSSKNEFYVWEKSENREDDTPPENFQIVYENYNFYILRQKNNLIL